MVHNLNNSNSIFNFSNKHEYVLKVNSGDVVEIETKDCFSDLVKSEEDFMYNMEWDKVNPATGPIYIEGARKGDVLKVTIKKINIKEKAVIATGKDIGVLGDKMNGQHCKVVDIKNDKIIFDNNLEIPVKKMIGVIGVAPNEEEINTGTPGSHGGNMDNTMVEEGATIYFPIFKDGAYFALGDVHAVMADGEIGGAGAEIGAFVTVQLEVINELKLNNPLLENNEFISTIASEKSIDKAVYTAVHDMLNIVKERVNLEIKDISMLFSITSNTEICQVVDPLKTARFVVPKWVLEKYNFRLL
ncbi:amidase [Clostridium cavendishii DSM 21758]|uniref:Amidase n=1 Tax=Clostridium cavendishii DSM 21758 TaxID=1121302 RepID=A0A1M6DD00_9CLOT|nr:acetamidase/formamidase family protein [Clostridium cavendishii]SHI71136.1 amidase [Clostridium cavendishii DSM 21758]